jgi:hypothetical protein
MVTRLAAERRRNLMSPQWLLLAALAMAVIAFATLCPMQWRPRLWANPDLERFAAFAALGFAAKLAFPRRHLWTVLGLVLVAAGLEAAQSLAPGRDAHVHDAVVKAIAAATGVQLGLVSLIARRAAARRLHEGLKALAGGYGQTDL